MNRLQGARRAFLGHITRAIGDITALLEGESSDLTDAQLETALAVLANRWANYERTGAELELLLDPEAANYEFLMEEHYNHQQAQFELVQAAQVNGERRRRDWEQVKVDGRNIALAAATPAPTFRMEAPRINVRVDAPPPPPPPPPAPRPLKLKPVDLQPFKGELTEWKAFWSVFEAGVHNQVQLTEVEKFTMLRQYLQDDALLTIKGLDVTPANYQVARDRLEARYDDDNAIISAHLAELDNLPSVKNPSDIAALRKFQLTVQLHISSLTALGVASAGYGTLLTTRLLQKIPEELLMKWFEDPAHNSTQLDPFMVFLTSRVEAQERFSRIKLLEDSKKVPVKSTKTSSSSEPSLSTSSALPIMEQSSHSVASRIKPNTARYSAQNDDAHYPCPFCTPSLFHKPSRCPLPVESRRRALVESESCFSCLRPGHIVKVCPNRMPRCFRCNDRHHSAVCPDLKGSHAPNAPRKKVSIAPIPPTITPPKKGILRSSTNLINDYSDPETIALPIHSEPSTLLQTASIVITGPGGRLKARCLLDNAAHHSYITRRIVEAIMLISIGKESMSIGGFGGKRSTGIYNRIEASISSVNGIHNVSLKALVTKLICNPIRRAPSGPWMKTLEDNNMQLADDPTGECDDIDLLIGADNYWKIVTGRTQLIKEGPMAVESLFGWLLSGQLREEGLPGSSAVLLSSSNENVYQQLQQMIDIESFDAPGPTTGVRHPVFTRFESTLIYNNKRYQTELPWKQPIPTLPSNERSVRQQLLRLVARLEGTPGLLDRYDAGIMDLLQRGFVELVVDEPTDPTRPLHYVAHHPVFDEERRTTKMRIVFNASGKTKNHPSLNDCLEPGPNLVPQLAAVLLRFRLFKVAITADIEKAFHQVTLHPLDRDSVRFFWINPVTKEVIKLRWSVVAFGVTSSPFLLAATLHHHLEKYKISHPMAVDVLSKHLYVDDLIAGADNVGDALKLTTDAKAILLEAGFPLRKFATNSLELQRILPDQSKEDVIPLDDDKPTKVLGLVWNRLKDCFTYETNPIFNPNEKRQQLNSMRLLLIAFSKLFDPLGFCSPFIIAARILYQELWRRKSKWDDPLPSDIAIQWQQWTAGLHLLSSVTIPRFYLGNLSEQVQLQLHTFCDASERAYGAVCYLRSVDSSGRVNVSLVISKAKVAPLKLQTVPRLELEAARLGVKLADYVLSALGSSIQVETFYWSDSTITLGWIRGEPHQWKTFVAHRVQLILLKSSREAWRHVRGDENPADLCSRGCSAESLVNSVTWFTGSWLVKSQKEWPGEPEPVIGEDDPDYWKEARAGQCLLAQVTDQLHSTVINLDRFSSWSRASRTMAWVRRFIFNCRNCIQNRQSGELTTNEIQVAKLSIIRLVQEESFPVEFLALQENQRVLRSSPLSSLRPYFDRQDRVIRLQRRTEHSTEESVDLVVLPAKGQLIKLLIWDAHIRSLHAGTSQTLTQTRSFTWILKGRRAVRDLLTKCVPCRRLLGPCINQPIAPLPAVRCSRSLAFESVGIDFAGPLYTRPITDKREPSKVYICLITCASTRAVHLELVQSLSNHHFMLAFRRFVAIRGLCRVVYSDNAKTFKAASKELEQMWSNLRSSEVKDFFSSIGIEWRFICERAPWWGGFYESLVRSVKTPLKKILSNSLLEFDELETILKEVEAIVNSRPLTYVYSALKEPEPITPSHFIIGKRMNLLPPMTTQTTEILEEPPQQLAKRARYRDRLLNSYWKMWREEYFLELSNRSSKAPVTEQTIKLRQIVVIHNDNVPRHKWHLGIIDKIIPGKDGIVRSVILRTQTGLLKRAVDHIYPLEVYSEGDLPENHSIPEDDEQTTDPQSSSSSSEEDSDRDFGFDPDTTPRGESVVNRNPSGALSTRSGRLSIPNRRYFNSDNVNY